MEHIKVANVPNVTVLRLGTSSKGTLHLTTHHLIFRDDSSKREIWVCYPIIADVERRPFNHTHNHSTIRIRCRDFTFLALNVASESTSKDIFDSIMKLTCVATIEKLYGFMYKPASMERKCNGWEFYNPESEFERMGTFAKGKWRWTDINKDYSFSPSYPARIVVPEAISDTTLKYGVGFRSKGRIPALTYYHKFNDCTITRCSQPMVGLKQNRSPQDEKFIAEIFATTTVPDKIGAQADNLIVDARPTANAMAQTALGAGTENMENYKCAKKVYLGIDNIHVMRDSLNKVVDVLKSGDVSPLPPSQELLYRSNWLRHLNIILEGAALVIDQVHFKFSHVVIHCSDGWDRTTQLSSIAQICLDPYFRTIDGFITLIEKDWLSFGHRFAERCGHLSSEKHFTQVSETNNQAQQVFNSVSLKLVKQSHVKYTSPVFHQFLDAIYQIVRQHPERFEYNERFLRRLHYHTYSCQYGTFLYNCERERVEADVASRTRSVWDYFLARRAQFTNKLYDTSLDSEADVLLFDPSDIRWWPELYGRSEQEMNSSLRRAREFMAAASPPASPRTIASQTGSAAATPPPPLASTTPVPASKLSEEETSTATETVILNASDSPDPAVQSLDSSTIETVSSVLTASIESSSDQQAPGAARMTTLTSEQMESAFEDHSSVTSAAAHPLAYESDGASELPSFLRREGRPKSGVAADELAKELKFDSLSVNDTKTQSGGSIFNKIAESTGFR